MSGSELTVCTEISLSITEGPNFLTRMSIEKNTDTNTVEIAVINKNDRVYALSKISDDKFWKIVDLLYPEGRPG